jgi:DNA-binding response OmpR family regulator
MQTHTILIIEDDATLRDALKTAFAYADFNVLTAMDGGTGLNLALSEHPDMILLDLMLPVMNGVEVLRQLRLDTWGSNTQVIVLTASEDLSVVADVVELGKVDYITKTDITLSEIVRKVKGKLG